MAKGFSVLLFLFLVTIFILGISLAYYLGLNSNKSQSRSTEQKPVSSQTPSPTNNISEGWINYNNKEYGISLKYPADFIVLNNDDSSAASYFYGNPPVLILKSSKGLYSHTSEVNPDVKNYTEAAIFTLGFSTDTTKCLLSSRDNQPITETVNVNGITFYKFKDGGVATGQSVGSEIYRKIQTNGCLEIGLHDISDTDGNNLDGAKVLSSNVLAISKLKQILATFSSI